MTNNFKIDVHYKDRKLVLEPVDGFPDQSVLTIKIDHWDSWDNNATGGAKGRIKNWEPTSSAFVLPVNNNPDDNAFSAGINRIQITGPTEILTTFRNLIILKNNLWKKRRIYDNSYEPAFELTVDKDINNQNDHWDITPKSAPDKHDRIVKLTVADFGGKLDLTKISIDEVDYDNSADNKLVKSRNDERQALLDLESLLKDLAVKYGMSNDRELNNATINLDLPENAPELGNPPDFTVVPPKPGTGLYAYLVGNDIELPSGKISITEEVRNIKHILFNLDKNYPKYIFSDKIKDLIGFF